MTLGHSERGGSTPVPKQSIHEITKSATLTEGGVSVGRRKAMDTLAEWIVAPTKTTAGLRVGFQI